MNDADKIVKRVKRRQLLGFFLMLAVVIAVIAFLPWAIYVKIPVAFVLGFLVWFAFLVDAALKVQRLLTFEMQPITWHYVAYKTGQASAQNMAVDADAAYLAGNYQAATDICLAQLAKPELKPLLRCGFCCVLAQIYFQTGELAALRNFLPAWEQVMQHPKLKKHARQIYGDELRYMQSFLQGDFAACLQLKKRLEALPPRQQVPFNLYNAMFSDAVALYHMGELSQARAELEVVRAGCPALYIAKLSADYIAAIDKGEAYCFVPAPEHTAPPAFPIAPVPGYKEKKHPKLRVAITLIVLAVIVLIAFLGEVLAPKYDPYEAILEYEEIVKLYHTVPLNEDGDALCIYTADDSWFYDEAPSEEYYFLRAAFLECEGEGDFVLIDYMDVEVGKTYYMDMGGQDVYVEFCVAYANQPIAGESKVLYSFTTHEGTACYLCIFEVSESENGRFFSDWGEK